MSLFFWLYPHFLQIVGLQLKFFVIEVFYPYLLLIKFFPILYPLLLFFNPCFTLYTPFILFMIQSSYRVHDPQTNLIVYFLNLSHLLISFLLCFVFSSILIRYLISIELICYWTQIVLFCILSRLCLCHHNVSSIYSCLLWDIIFSFWNSYTIFPFVTITLPKFSWATNICRFYSFHVIFILIVLPLHLL